MSARAKAFLTSLLVLSFFPLAWFRARLIGAAGESEVERLTRQLADARLSMETLRRTHSEAWQSRDLLRLRLQHIIEDGGGVPADIPLWARVECLVAQRDGRCPIPDAGRFGRAATPEREAKP